MYHPIHPTVFVKICDFPLCCSSLFHFMLICIQWAKPTIYFLKKWIFTIFKIILHVITASKAIWPNGLRLVLWAIKFPSYFHVTYSFRPDLLYLIDFFYHSTTLGTTLHEPINQATSTSLGCGRELKHINSQGIKSTCWRCESAALPAASLQEGSWDVPRSRTTNGPRATWQVDHQEERGTWWGAAENNESTQNCCIAPRVK